MPSVPLQTANVSLVCGLMTYGPWPGLIQIARTGIFSAMVRDAVWTSR
jgi:hypothetical protein